MRDLEWINCFLPESQTPSFSRGRGLSDSHTEGDSGFSRGYSESMIHIATCRRNMRLHEEDRRFQMHFLSHWPGSTAYSTTLFGFQPGSCYVAKAGLRFKVLCFCLPSAWTSGGSPHPIHISSPKRARRPQPASHPWTRLHVLSLGWPLAQAVPTDKCSKCLNSDSCSQASVAD